MRGALIALLPITLWLGGCILPPGAAVASFAADGASYAASGKSLSDHGISVAADKDCATWHFFVGRAVCEDPKQPIAAAPLEQRRSYAARPPANVLPSSTAPPSVPAAGSYFVVGSFADPANADRYAGRYAAYHPRLQRATQGGRDVLRVILGPLDAAQIAVLRGHGVAGYLLKAPPANARELAQTSGVDAEG
jgi:hypothetical protein